MSLLRLIWVVVRALFANRADLVAENLALRQQLAVLSRSTRRPRLRQRDRIFWVWLARCWSGWRDILIVVKPATVVRWHRQGFKYYWAWKSRHKGGRPAIDPEVRELIRKMSRANPLWGAPRIHGELLKLGIDLSQTTIALGGTPPSRFRNSRPETSVLRARSLFIISASPVFNAVKGRVTCNLEAGQSGRRILGATQKGRVPCEQKRARVRESYPSR